MTIKCQVVAQIDKNLNWEKQQLKLHVHLSVLECCNLSLYIGQNVIANSQDVITICLNWHCLNIIC